MESRKRELTTNAPPIRRMRRVRRRDAPLARRCVAPSYPDARGRHPMIHSAFGNAAKSQRVV
ncbi:hypothetical protein BURPS1106B_A3504 [Burkholderia pseudomallei 1106b]|uniref:Uncharacterized protein n=1 Tax=Burkholderia pseudomallei (strain 1106a) TaxID=357348 RepID=A3NQ83_BURP0|nr:hypothetical protein BURPS1106A_0221 [Burkholderia pseudomallei 1106a]EBA45060.1 hypothetical protein BURPS305_0768 [Burkholderia pseudomallei 305]EES26208.1 hypothetical protein BURPS1106B_A3504 [Burkholderia pseudomallei 1106b]